MDETHALPGPPVRPVQGRRPVANTDLRPRAVGAPPGSHVAAWLGPSRSAEDGCRGRYPQTRRCGVNGPPTAAHSSVTTPTGSRGRPSAAPGPAHLRFRGPAGGTLLIKREGLNDAALVRQPHAVHLLRIDPRRRRAVLPALSRAAGSHMTHEPEASWILVVGDPRSACLIARAVPGSPASGVFSRLGVTFIRSGGCSGHLTRPIVARAPRTLGAGDVTNIFPAFAGTGRPVL